MEDKKNQNFKNEEPVYSVKQKAGKRRTYFFDVRETKNSDYYVTITESKKRDDGSYARHKIYLYKEDFNKFMESFNEVVNHVKTTLMPDYDYDEFARRQEEYERNRAEGNLNNGDAGYSDNSNNNNNDSAPPPTSSSAPPPPASNDEPQAPPASDEDLKW